MAALVAGGLVQELLLLGGHPELGIILVVPLLIAVVGLWRPRPEVVALVLIAVGLELLVPLHTGGGRYQDWLLHYEIALNYSGLPNDVLHGYLPGRTPLFHQLIASALRHNPSYWAFQTIAVLLNSLWLWPASLLIERAHHNQRSLRIFAVALAPVVLAYSIYTWPWNFCAFFLLAALYLVEEPTRLAQVGVGVALSAALLAHPGSLGYVAGLGLWWVWKQRRAVVWSLVGGLLVGATAVPWVIDITDGHGPGAIVGGSVPALQSVPPAQWLLSRLLLLAHTGVPPTTFPDDRFLLNLAVAFFVLTLPGALVTVLATGRTPVMRPPVFASIAAGVAVNIAIYPANQYASGLLDGLYLGVLVYLVEVVSGVGSTRIHRIHAASVALAVVTTLALVWLAVAPVAGDANAALRTSAKVIYFEQRWGWAPGLLLLSLGVGLAVWAALPLRRIQPSMP